MIGLFKSIGVPVLELVSDSDKSGRQRSQKLSSPLEEQGIEIRQ